MGKSRIPRLPPGWSGGLRRRNGRARNEVSGFCLEKAGCDGVDARGGVGLELLATLACPWRLLRRHAAEPSDDRDHGGESEVSVRFGPRLCGTLFGLVPLG